MSEEPKSPNGIQGQGDLPPTPEGEGQGKKPPTDAQGQEEDKITLDKKDYEALRSDRDRLATERSRMVAELEELGIAPEYLELGTKQLKQFYLETMQKQKEKDDDYVPPDEADEKEKALQRKLDASATATWDARSRADWTDFRLDHPEFDKSLKPKLEAEVSKLLRENPTLFRKGNIYEVAERSLILTDPSYRTSIEQSAVKREDERRKQLGDMQTETGGVKAKGTSKTLTEELQEKLG